VLQQVADRREEERRPTVRRAGLDDELRPNLMQDLLIDPQVGRVLLDLGAEPERTVPGLTASLVVDASELVDDPFDPPPLQGLG